MAISDIFDTMGLTDKQALSKMNEHYYDLQNSNWPPYMKKNCFEHMKKLYDNYPIIRKVWQYIETARQYIKRFVKICYASIEEILGKDTKQYFYVMRFYDRNNKWLFDKIGSTKNIKNRMKQHLDYYEYASSVELLTAIPTDDIPASTVEDYARNYCIKKYGEKNFLPKDRFKCKLDIEDLQLKIPTCIEKLKEAIIL